MTLSKHNETRARRILDALRSRHPEFGSTSDDWINNPERMERCAESAKDGADGSTHAEYIQDWRDIARCEVSHYQTRLESLLCSYLDDLEDWHEQNGSLHEQVG